MRLPQRRSLASAYINMTPMIDVTFQLIIFFLLSSRLAQQETQMELDLPAAASGREAVDDDRPRLTVNVSAEGRVMLSSTETPREEMAGRLRIERERLGRDLEVRVRADRSVPYRAVAPILLACAEAGIWNVTFAVVEKVEGRAEDSQR
ncbi:MAG TPA: biopolymer transporter ExbD [Lacipirellulaceae bacterium]|jgi:biopolymer transport protein ExbD|nr:biopolymer transporter ExbD [Lacipirellulaceae bacterium]